MKGRFSRLVIALALASSLLASSITATALTRQQPQDSTQTQGQSTTGQSKTTPDQNPPAKTDDNQNQPVVPTKAANAKPLSVNEDPSMIGKRNINKGIIAKMSGSTEKEVKLGQQIAAEVDREAKFIDDPLITEYINRVGQNIVLHSDAKVTFTIKVIDSD